MIDVGVGYLYSNVGIDEGVFNIGHSYTYKNVGISDDLTESGVGYLYKLVVDSSFDTKSSYIVCDIWHGGGSKSPMILG